MTTTNTIHNTHVEPLTSPRTGEPVKNQYVITSGDCRAFQSYSSLIAVYDWSENVLTLGYDWDYSVTTMKYLQVFLRDYCWSIYREMPDGKSGADSIRKAIKSGLIKYDPSMK